MVPTAVCHTTVLQNFDGSIIRGHSEEDKGCHPELDSDENIAAVDGWDDKTDPVQSPACLSIQSKTVISLNRKQFRGEIIPSLKQDLNYPSTSLRTGHLIRCPNLDRISIHQSRSSRAWPWAYQGEGELLLLMLLLSRLLLTNQLGVSTEDILHDDSPQGHLPDVTWAALHFSIFLLPSSQVVWVCVRK